MPRQLPVVGILPAWAEGKRLLSDIIYLLILDKYIKKENFSTFQMERRTPDIAICENFIYLANPGEAMGCFTNTNEGLSSSAVFTVLRSV